MPSKANNTLCSLKIREGPAADISGKPLRIVSAKKGKPGPEEEEEEEMNSRLLNIKDGEVVKQNCTTF